MGRSDQIRILLVDDDAAIRRLLALLFSREGWIVTMEADGEHVLDTMASFNPDVVVLDLMMPKVSGFELLERLQETSPASLKRIIILTAVSTSALGSLKCQPALWAVIRKPFDNGELISSIRECARWQQQIIRRSARFRHSEPAA